MSDEVKKPEAGEYWEHETSGDRVYFIGATPENEMVWQCHGDTIEAGNLDWTGWHHLPDCTGWDWQPETFPQYWTTIDSPDQPAAYVIRISKDRYRVVYKNGTIHKFEDTWECCDFSYRTQITKEQAEALLDKPTPIQPDPEEWVDLPQDHSLRACLDRFSNCLMNWEIVSGLDGTIVRDLVTKKAQCRRKDLPPQPSTRHIAVRLYWYDGNIVGRYDHSQPTDESFQEIKSDGNGGWFVEGCV